MTLHDLLLRPVQWQASGGAEYPYFATVDGRRWRVRINDFPAEALYTLLIEAKEAGDFDDWPPGWVRPG